jgi:hypothetical protein
VLLLQVVVTVQLLLVLVLLVLVYVLMLSRLRDSPTPLYGWQPVHLYRPVAAVAAVQVTTARQALQPLIPGVCLQSCCAGQCTGLQAVQAAWNAPAASSWRQQLVLLVLVLVLL